MKPFICDKCEKEHNYKDELVFDGDELKTVDERNPDWDSCTCNTCFYQDESFK